MSIILTFLVLTFLCIVFISIVVLLPFKLGGFALLLCFMSIWSHIATVLTDPGSVPQSAEMTLNDQVDGIEKVYCLVCDSYKPPKSHHCRICRRCIAGMDHYCPWTNNAIGAKNLKLFLLFLIYSSLGSMYTLIAFSINYVIPSFLSYLCSSSLRWVV